MAVWDWLWGKKKTYKVEEMTTDNYIGELQFFIYDDNEVKGPFSLSELKMYFIISPETQITTDTLNGEWYDAKHFEYFDDFINKDDGFSINEFGEIKR